MANFPVPENPVYSNEMRMIATTDPAHPDSFNPLFQKLLNNGEYLKKREDTLEETVIRDVNEKVAGMSGDIADITFQLAVKGLIETTTMENVAVDIIDSPNAVNIISGNYADNRVYI